MRKIGQPDIWEPEYIRLFISHRENFKKEGLELKENLKEFGVSSFVAHDTIQPLEEWEPTILEALKSMDVMLAFITDNFFEGFWMNQEIGFSIGREILIIPLKLQETNPKGFISSIQAVLGTLESPKGSANYIKC